MKFPSFLLALFAISPTLLCSQTEAPKESGPQLSQQEVMKDFSSFGPAEYEEGKALYGMVCTACHGNEKTPASVPNARAFHQDKLLNGSDPYKLYETLSKGFNQMPPQLWMTPEQKYYVIHYLREEFFKTKNPSQYVALDDAYIASVPADEIIAWSADRKAPVARKAFNPAEVDHGRAIFGHFESSLNNVAPKGLIVSLEKGVGVTQSKHHALYDLDTGRLVAVNEGELLDWRDLNYNGEHRIHSKLAGKRVFESPIGLAWAKAGEVFPGRYPDFRDPRDEALNGRKYGPLPDERLHYLGLNLTTEIPTVHYTVEGTEVLEMTTAFEKNGRTSIIRSLLLKPHEKMLYLRTHGKRIETRLFAEGNAARMINGGGINEGIIEIAPSGKDRMIHFLAGEVRDDLIEVKADEFPVFTWPKARTAESARFLGKAPAADAPKITAEYRRIVSDGAFEVEEAVLPQEGKNPWNTKIRFSGIDYLSSDVLAMSSWTGDLFIVDGIRGEVGDSITLRRIASGLHQPLGLKVRDGQIFVGCRDQIMRPHDLDDDGIADYYESFNSDHVLSMHFHEFAGGLDTDADGNFYYVKCSQHADAAFFPQHGTLIKVSADGKKSEIIANGLRSANGCFVDTDGRVWTTDQEGFWNPQNKIMRVEPGKFHGNMLGYYDPEKITASDEDMVEPMVWLPKAYANSPSEVFRFPAKGWGGFSGKLGYYEYGQGKIMVLPYEEKNGSLQGLAQPLPIPAFASGIMRGRFHPEDGTLYGCGLFGWGSVRTETGGFYRIRPTEKPASCVVGFQTAPSTLTLEFSEPQTADAITEGTLKLTSYTIKRSASYGSKLEDETSLNVEKSEWSKDGKTLTLTIPDLAPTRVLYIDFEIKSGAETRKERLCASIYEL